MKSLRNFGEKRKLALMFTIGTPFGFAVVEWIIPF